MEVFDRLFSSRSEDKNAYATFWKWFAENQQRFHEVVMTGNDVEEEFLNELSEKLEAIRDGFFFITGVADSDTVKLVFSADGVVKNIVFVEELVDAAPAIEGWQFIALKPAWTVDDLGIEMDGHEFNSSVLSFCVDEDPAYPDRISITVVHHHFDEKDSDAFTQGVYLFIDHLLGELDSVTTIDNLTVQGKEGISQELIPISKLKDYIKWRQSEFIEKYEGERRDTAEDNYVVMEADLESGGHMIAVANLDLLEWDRKASHPWLFILRLSFDGRDEDGFQDDATDDEMEFIEDQLGKQLPDFEGYLNVGRQTEPGVRDLFFACKDFRKPSKVLDTLVRQYEGPVRIEFEIFKDKYWETLNHLRAHDND